MKRGVTISAVMHLVLLVLVIFGLPLFFDPKPLIEPTAITVELLPISEVSNVKPQVKTQPKKTPPKPTPVKPVEKEKVKPQPPTKQEKNPEPVVPKPEPVVAPEKPKEDKPKKEPEKPKEPEKEKPKKDDEEDLDAILKSVEKTAQDTKPDKSESEAAENDAKDDNYDPTMPLSIAERDMIRGQISKCWTPPMGAKDAEGLAALLRVTFEKDGSLIEVYLHKSQQGRYNSDSFFRAAADSAMRAVRACTPLKGMSQDKYGSWKDVELNFDPRDALY